MLRFSFHEAMLIVRSLLFNVAFYANLVLWLVLLFPGLLVPPRL
jgi:1-acyl-sn-glycerol-3-phosphate acyltransferase